MQHTQGLHFSECCLEVKSLLTLWLRLPLHFFFSAIEDLGYISSLGKEQTSFIACIA